MSIFFEILTLISANLLIAINFFLSVEVHDIFIVYLMSDEVTLVI